MIAAQDAAIAALAPAIAKRFLTAGCKQAGAVQQRQNLRRRPASASSPTSTSSSADGKIVSGRRRPLPQAAGRTRAYRWRRQDAGAGPVGQPHARRRRFQTRSVNWRSASPHAAIPAGRSSCEVSQRERRNAGTLLAPERFDLGDRRSEGPARRAGQPCGLEPRGDACGRPQDQGADLTAGEILHVDEAGVDRPRRRSWRTSSASTSTATSRPACARSTRSTPAMTRSRTSISRPCRRCREEVVAKSNTTMRLLGPGQIFQGRRPRCRADEDGDRDDGQEEDRARSDAGGGRGRSACQGGNVAPAYAPYAGTLPAATERGFKSGPIPYLPGMTRADAPGERRSHGRICDEAAALRRADRRRAPTGTGMELVRELELYVKGGLTPAEALATATIAPARNVKVDKRTGSIAVGKEADLAAGRWRPGEEHRRPSPCRPGHERRRADGRRRAAQGSRVQRPTEVIG